jgi:hypothetical protein
VLWKCQICCFLLTGWQARWNRYPDWFLAVALLERIGRNLQLIDNSHNDNHSFSGGGAG